MTVYKIRNPKTGLFSTGGSSPRWTRRGKTWSGLGPLKLHLGMFADATARGARLTRTYDGCEIVAFEVAESEAGHLPVAEVLAAVVERKADAERQWKNEWARRRVERLEAELATARAELAARKQDPPCPTP